MARQGGLHVPADAVWLALINPTVSSVGVFVPSVHLVLVGSGWEKPVTLLSAFATWGFQLDMAPFLSLLEPTRLAHSEHLSCGLLFAVWKRHQCVALSPYNCWLFDHAVWCGLAC